MKFRTRTCTATISLFALLAISVRLAAQDDQGHMHHHYKLIDMGTFGGPNSNFNAGPIAKVLNNRGQATSEAATAIPDPYAPNCFLDCLVDLSFVYQDGIRLDLFSLPGGVSSFPYWINEFGVIVGESQNGLIDPLTGFPEADAVSWQDGEITNLGTLGGNQSIGASVNDKGFVVGGALNSTSDPFGNGFSIQFLFAPATTETHAALWQAGVIQDLGTLGGPDSYAGLINNRGQIAGVSYTNSTSNNVATAWCGTNVPTLDPFFWENGQMTNMGNLGGTCGIPNWINKRGQVVGEMDLAGDVNYHPFLWDKKKGLRDLKTLGGNTGLAISINDAGAVVGQADLAGSGTQLHHGFLWRYGAMTDLGTVDGDPCSRAISINSRGQIVGASTNCTEFQHGFLWESGSIVDLNTLVEIGSGVTVIDGENINERGEIAGSGLLSNGDLHSILLIPCDENHRGLEGCDYSMVDAKAAAELDAARAATLPASDRNNNVPVGPRGQLHSRLAHRYPSFGVQPMK